MEPGSSNVPRRYPAMVLSPSANSGFRNGTPGTVRMFELKYIGV
jgi:hypothetical protein